MSDMSIGIDEFGVALESILADVSSKVKRVPEPAVKKGLQKGARSWRKNAPRMTGRYAASIRWHITRGGDSPSGEIGSPSLPGLPHLLEKGHARVGGGRVPGIPHIAPAAEEAFDATEQEIIKGIEGAL